MMMLMNAELLCSIHFLSFQQQMVLFLNFPSFNLLAINFFSFLMFDYFVFCSNLQINVKYFID